MLNAIISLSEFLVAFALAFTIFLAVVSVIFLTLILIKTPDYKKLAKQAKDEVDRP